MAGASHPPAIGHAPQSIPSSSLHAASASAQPGQHCPRRILFRRAMQAARSPQTWSIGRAHGGLFTGRHGRYRLSQPAAEPADPQRSQNRPGTDCGAHHSFLFQLATEPSTGWRWTFGGAIPSIDEFVANLWRNVAAQFVVTRLADRTPIGHVMLYGVDLHQGHGNLSAVSTTEAQSSGLLVEASLVFLRYCYTLWNLRKVYLELPEYNLPQFGSGLRGLMRQEAKLTDHTYYGGRYWDRIILAIYIEDLRSHDATFDRFLGPS